MDKEMPERQRDQHEGGAVLGKCDTDIPSTGA
jgi:hypothetical protein